MSDYLSVVKDLFLENNQKVLWRIYPKWCQGKGMIVPTFYHSLRKHVEFLTFLSEKDAKEYLNNYIYKYNSTPMYAYEGGKREKFYSKLELLNYKPDVSYFSIRDWTGRDYDSEIRIDFFTVPLIVDLRVDRL